MIKWHNFSEGTLAAWNPVIVYEKFFKLLSSMEPSPEIFYQLQMFSNSAQYGPSIAKQNGHKDSGREGNSE